ncbi:hypothetical protein [Streptomyces sp. XD-27]|uniref:hypothetical protein n=1 Tax=Streptomyces sp. XD-27 TaxID=3062779 RepID=UPI0026F43E25|nr:hypothetical protein [Streptomyces sp. XD-27]WKX73255.1 hypothetical protein Q3Y56_28175 [Streptomyces sp. XD-27]
MRSTRTLIAGAVLGTALTLGTPAAALADVVTDPGTDEGYTQTQPRDPSSPITDHGAQPSGDEADGALPDKDKDAGDMTKGQSTKGMEQDATAGQSKGDEGQHPAQHPAQQPAKGHEGQVPGKGHEGMPPDEGHEGREPGKGHEGVSPDEQQRPHGGVQTGGGGMALDSGAGMAAGAVLLVGGVGAGAYVLRRRTPSGTSV